MTGPGTSLAAGFGAESRSYYSLVLLQLPQCRASSPKDMPVQQRWDYRSLRDAGVVLKLVIPIEVLG